MMFPDLPPEQLLDTQNLRGRRGPSGYYGECPVASKPFARESDIAGLEFFPSLLWWERLAREGRTVVTSAKAWLAQWFRRA